LRNPPSGKHEGKKKPSHPIFRRFWEELLEVARGKTTLYSGISAPERPGINGSTGTRGLLLNLSVTQYSASAELWIDRGSGAEEENLQIFDALYKSKAEIEADFGEPLEWLRPEKRRACRIVHRIDTGGYLDEEVWPQLQAEMVDAIARLERAMRPRIDDLQI
jgi:uncharacterized protein DUF4268